MKNKDIIIALNEEILIGYMRKQLYAKGFKEKKKYSKLIKEVCERLESMYNESLINQSAKNILLTNKGERFCNLNYGTNVGEVLFGPFDRETTKRIYN